MTNSAEDAQRHGPFIVLVPLDGSELAAKALPVAVSICAKIPGAELICLSVLPTTALPYGLWGMPPYLAAETYQKMWDEQEQFAREALKAAAATAGQQGVHASVLTQRGDVASVILDTAARLRVSLIVMTSHGRTGLARFTLGSVADRVVRGSATPVLLLRSFQPPDTSAATLQRALAPLDGSTLSETALTGIIPQLAGFVINEVTLLQVVDARDGDEAVTQAADYLAHARQRLLDRLGARACEVQTLVRAGPVAQTILECAQSTACGVVIMATYSEMGIGRLALGTVTDRVLRDGHTPLLLAHPHSATPA